MPCSPTLLQPWLLSRGDLPIFFSWNGHIIVCVFLADRFALSFVAVLTRSSCPFVPMMQSTLPNNSDNHLFLLFSAPLRSVAPFGTTSPSCKRLPHRLCVAKSGERSAERYHNLKASADHRFASCAAMQGFQPLCFAPMVFRTAPSCTCTTLCLCRHQLLLLFRSRFDPAGFPFAKFYFTPQSYGIPRNSKGRFALRVPRRFVTLQRRNHPCFCGNPLTMPFCGSVKFKILSK